jgi:hypothetical protein
MRVSLDPDDDGFDPVKAEKVRVLLDGKIVTAITADDVKGEAYVLLRDNKGTPVLNPASGTPWFVWKTGHVQILSVQ